ncbi:SET domain-containing protein SmydA-8 isoform X3 [Bacillus rossius redtenbacheri]|uniref:SET domain-containing protein SmydA-8 isoform X3 n=1 Tax=Bacillus rossius redtenbacheri TaxID=93214 RepID=UPI002FDD7BD1
MRPGAGGGLLVAAAMTLHDLTSCAVCTQPATQQCDACQLVAYCPGEHEEQHRAKCPAYKVLTNVAVGRFAVAARDLAAGESIFSELPVAVGPKADSSPLCLGCHGLVDGSASCSRCGWPVCGPGCEDSPVHAAAECEVFRAAGVAFQPPQDWTETCCQMECVTPLRLLLSREKCPGRWTREVDAMQSNDERRRDLDAWRAEQVNVVGFLRDRCGLADRFDEQSIHRACGLLEVNAFEIRMVAGTTIRGLYPQTAILSHNCVANTSHTITPQSDYRLTLRATVAVPRDAELFSSYTYSLDPTMVRRQHLSSGKFFDCRCERCRDPTELGTHLGSLKCNKCDPGLILASDPLDPGAAWRCTHCEFSTSGAAAARVMQVVREEAAALDWLPPGEEAVEAREKLWRKYRSVLHPRHSVVTGARLALSQLYGRAEGYHLDELPDILLERKADICRDLLAVADVVEPGLTRLRGMTLYELHAPVMVFAKHRHDYGEISAAEFRAKLEEAAAILQEAVRILLLEDPLTPEGAVGRVAEQSLQQLRASIASLAA